MPSSEPGRAAVVYTPESVQRLLARLQEAEARARDFEERYQLLLSGADDGLWYWDLDTRQISLSPRWKQILGYEDHEIQNDIEEWRSRLHPDDRERVASAVQHYLDGLSSTLAFESRMLHKDGQHRWVATRGAALRDATGKAYRMAGAHWDIAARKQAEEQLREREQQYRSIFEATSDALLICDLDSELIVEANPAASRMYGYSHEEFVGLHPTVFTHPSQRERYADFLNTARAGGELRRRALNVKRDGTLMHIEVHGASFSYQGKPHLLCVLRDITDEMVSYQQMEQRIDERTRDLATLLDVSRSLSSTIELEPLLELIMDQLHIVADYTSCVVITREGDRLVNRAYRGPLPAEVVLSRTLPITPGSPAWLELQTGAAGIIADIWDETPQARILRTAMGEEYLRTTASYIRCWLGVPLRHQGELVGALALTHRQPGYFTERHAALTSAIASQVAAAIANATHYDEAQERTRELSALLDISNILASTLDLRSMLDRLLDHLETIVEHDGCAVSVVDGDELVTLGSRNPSLSQIESTRGPRTPLARIAHFWDRFPRRQPVIIADVTGDTADARAYRAVVTERAMHTTHAYVRSWMTVPMALQDRVIGMLSVRSRKPHLYTERDARLAAAIANQLAVAIENARLYERSQHAAVLEERQRLARELHDSVSQALFGIGLGSRSALRLLEQGQPDRALRSVEYVAGLAETGMAEMRALIFELRPESLATEGLVAALGKQAEAVRARYSIAVETELCSEPEAPLDVKEALYRIAQEAMHNTVKHAGASRISLRLADTPEGLTLEVQDDGQGFDPSGAFPGHLGLRTMHERAERFGGALTIESRPGEGATVRVSVPRQ